MCIIYIDTNKSKMEDLATRSMLPYACSVTDLDRILLDRNLLVLYNKQMKENVNEAFYASVLQ